MKITFLGHACILIETAGKSIIVDPFISGNPLINNADELLNGIHADYMLITHAHQDHVLDVEAIAAKNKDVQIISNFEIVTYYSNRGIAGHAMNHGGSFSFDFGRITMVNAWHSSSFADGTYGGNPAGFVVENNGKSVYIAGDTGLTKDMQLIPLFTNLDLAILPVGDNFTMGVDSAVIAADFVQSKKVLAYHFDTWPPIKLDKNYAKSAFDKAGVELTILDIGKSMEI